MGKAESTFSDILAMTEVELDGENPIRFIGVEPQA